MTNAYAGIPEVAEEFTIRDIVRSVIASQSSQELPYFTRLARTGDPWVLWRLRHRRGRDEPLGFGLGEIATLATPVIWITLNEAAKKFGSAAGDGIFAGVGALLRRILRRKPRLATVPPLTQEQREQIRHAVHQELLNRKFKDQRAADIANAVLQELSVAAAPSKE